MAEAVEALSKEEFYVVTTLTPDGKPGQLHLSLSDASGDSAIFQYVGDKLQIYHDRSYQVMTNSPTFDKQLALNDYWEEIGGLTMLPAPTARRTVCPRLLLHQDPAKDRPGQNEAVARVMSVMRNVSVPMGIQHPGSAQHPTTLWRSVADQQHRRYFFELTHLPSARPAGEQLDKLDLAAGAGAQLLPLTGQQLYAGRRLEKFVPAKAFSLHCQPAPRPERSPMTTPRAQGVLCSGDECGSAVGGRSALAKAHQLRVEVRGRRARPQSAEPDPGRGAPPRGGTGSAGGSDG